MLVSLAGQLERESQDAVYPASCENCLLNRHLLACSLVETPANVGIFAFVVLPNDAEINLTRLPVLQRSFNALEKAHGPQIDVLSETPADGDQQSPKRDVIRNAWVSHGAEEDSVKRPQLLDTIRRHHLRGLYVGFAAPLECIPVALKSKMSPRGVQHPDAFWNHLFSDAVACDDCDVEGFHARCTLPFFRGKQWKQRAHIRNRIQGLNKCDDFLGLDLWPVCRFGTSPEFGRCFFKSHGIRRAALGKIGPTRDHSPILQMDLQERGHLVVTGALGLRIHVKVYPLHHILYVGSLNHFV